MAKKKTRRTRTRKGISKDWGRRDGVQTQYTTAKICIPAGYCPVELADCDIESVRAWVVSLTNHKPHEHTYAPTVYKYWVRHFYDFQTLEFKTTQQNLDKIVKSDIKTIADLEDEMPSVQSS